MVLGGLLLAFASSPSAHAEPEPESWPSIRFFEPLDAAAYTVPGADGVWFTAPTGQNCGIWSRGSFACRGEIPGAPPGTEAVGWVTGDRAMHYDWSVPFRMPPTRAHSALPSRTFLEHHGTTCAVTGDGQTYCERGPLRFLITNAGTWLTPPWMDLRRR
jgi:hypothetical protein